MRKYMKSIISSAECAILLLFVSPVVWAEGESSKTPAAYEVCTIGELWQQSTNAAGLLIDDPFQRSTLDAGYNNYQGSFHRPQQGEKGSLVFINTEGSTKLKSAYVWGRFSYSREQATNSVYNASILDPYRGMPYYVADSLPSDWNKQSYDLQFKVATPKIWNALSFGLEASYKAYLGAKQRDPRTDNRFYTLEFKPGVVFSPNEFHNIGLNLEYYNLKEESYMSTLNYTVDPTYYEMYGLGNSIKGLGSGRTTNYVGNDVGAGFQYNYNGCVHLLFAANYSLKVEDVSVSFTNPKDDSSTKDQILSTALTVYKKGQALTHYLKLGFSDRKIDGIQYVTQYDNSTSQLGWLTLYKGIRSTYETQTANADYSLFINKGDEYLLRVDAGAGYEKQSDVYLIPRSTMNYENLIFHLGGKWNIALSDKLDRRLLIGAGAAYHKNLSGAYNYHGQHSDYPVVTIFEQSDLNYLMSDYYALNASVVYSQKYSESKNTSLFAKIAADYSKTSDFNYNERTFAQVSVGFNF